MLSDLLPNQKLNDLYRPELRWIKACFSHCQPLHHCPENTKQVEELQRWEAESFIRDLNIRLETLPLRSTGSESSASLMQLWIAAALWGTLAWVCAVTIVVV